MMLSEANHSKMPHSQIGTVEVLIFLYRKVNSNYTYVPCNCFFKLRIDLFQEFNSDSVDFLL